jgi:hypothetical protein
VPLVQPGAAQTVSSTTPAPTAITSASAAPISQIATASHNGSEIAAFRLTR